MGEDRTILQVNSTILPKDCVCSWYYRTFRLNFICWESRASWLSQAMASREEVSHHDEVHHDYDCLLNISLLDLCGRYWEKGG